MWTDICYCNSNSSLISNPGFKPSLFHNHSLLLFPSSSVSWNIDVAWVFSLLSYIFLKLFTYVKENDTKIESYMEVRVRGWFSTTGSFTKHLQQPGLSQGTARHQELFLGLLSGWQWTHGLFSSFSRVINGELSQRLSSQDSNCHPRGMLWWQAISEHTMPQC